MKGISFLRAHERIYHWIVSLLLNAGQHLKFDQLYVVDNGQSFGAGGTIFQSATIPSVLDKSLLIDLTTMLQKDNHNAKVFRSAVEDNPNSFYMKFNTDPKSRNQYILPATDSKIGGFIPDAEDFTAGRYIVVRTHGGYLRNISPFSAAFKPLHFP